MIKLTQLINELGINNPNVTAEEVNIYYVKNIYNGHAFSLNLFNQNNEDDCWKEYVRICQPYLKKYGMNYWLSTDNFYQLSQSDLNQFYKEMKRIVHRCSTINELGINEPIYNINKALKLYETIINNRGFYMGTIGYNKLKDLYYITQINNNISKSNTSIPYVIKNIKGSELYKFCKNMLELYNKYKV